MYTCESCCKLSCEERGALPAFGPVVWGSVSDWAGGIRHKKAQRNKSKFLTPQPYCWFGALSAIKERQPLCKIQYVDIYIYIFDYIWYLFFLLLISSWGIGCCNDTYVQTIFLEGHGEKTIPKRYPNDTPKRNLRALGRRSPAHPPTWTKHWHTKSWCNVFPFHISWVEAMAWKKEKKNQTLLSKATSKGFDHYPNIPWPKNPTFTLGSSIWSKPSRTIGSTRKNDTQPLMSFQCTRGFGRRSNLVSRNSSKLYPKASKNSVGQCFLMIDCPDVFRAVIHGKFSPEPEIYSLWNKRIPGKRFFLFFWIC